MSYSFTSFIWSFLLWNSGWNLVHGTSEMLALSFLCFLFQGTLEFSSDYSVFISFLLMMSFLCFCFMRLCNLVQVTLCFYIIVAEDFLVNGYRTWNRWEGNNLGIRTQECKSKEENQRGLSAALQRITDWPPSFWTLWWF